MSRHNSGPPLPLLTALEENDLWMREAAEGSDSLIRAISAALVFSELRALDLQNRLSEFLEDNYKRIEFRFAGRFAAEQLRSDYVRDPFRPEFEAVTVELASHVLHCRLKLYTCIGDHLSCEIFPQKTKKTLRIARIVHGRYAALLPKATLEAATICQQLVLQMVDRTLCSDGHSEKRSNSSNFIVFDRDRQRIKPFSHIFEPKKPDIRHPKRPFSETQDDDRPLWGRDATEEASVGRDLLQMIKNRKSNAPLQADERRWNFLQSFVDPLTFLDTVQLHAPESSGRNSATSDENFEEYRREFDDLNEKLTSDVELDLSNSNRTTKHTLQSLSDSHLEPVLVDKHSDPHPANKTNEPVPGSSLDLVTSSSANFEDLNWSVEIDEAIKGPKHTLKQKLQQKKKGLLQEFVPILPVSSPQPASLDKSIRNPKTETTALNSSLGGHSQVSQDRYIETIDPILYEGKLKFFDEKNGYGFILVNEEGTVRDLFVYRSELERTKVPLDSLRQVKNGLQLFFSFQIAKYTTKGQVSKKAINLRLIRKPDLPAIGSAFHS